MGQTILALIPANHPSATVGSRPMSAVRVVCYGGIVNNGRESLARTLGCYLHQDWAAEFESVADAIGAILRECTPRDIAEAASEIDALITSASDQQLIEALADAGCFYNPPGDRLDHRDWLLDVRDRFVANDR